MIPVTFDITLFVIAVIGAVVAVGMALLRQLLAYSERKRINGAEQRNAQLRKRQEQMTEQYRRTQDRVREAEADIKVTHTQLLEVQRRIQLAKADNYMIVHELGEAAAPNTLFIGTLGLGALLTVANATSKDSLLRGVRHLLEVWASNEAHALDLARRSFPAEGGFIVSRLQRADAAQGGADAGRADGRGEGRGEAAGAPSARARAFLRPSAASAAAE